MAEIGSIRGGDGSIPGEDVEKKDEPQFLQSTTRLAILSAMAPTRGEAEIRDLRRLVLAAEPTKTYTIPSQVEPKYTCDVCGNRDQTKFLHESTSQEARSFILMAVSLSLTLRRAPPKLSAMGHSKPLSLP